MCAGLPVSSDAMPYLKKFDPFPTPNLALGGEKTISGGLY